MSSTSRCRSCGSSNLALVLSLGDIPLAQVALREEEIPTEQRYPLEVGFCRDCALVQVLETVPREVVFNSDYPYYSSVSETLLEHCRVHAAQLIERHNLGADSFVVELASNDGYMLRNFVERGIPVLGVDPAEGPARVAVERGIPTRCAFFGEELANEIVAERGQADLIIAMNVIAHVPDPNSFVAGIARLLKPGGDVVVEIPYVRELVDHCEFDTIYHEHYSYWSITSMDRLMRRHGLFINDFEKISMHGGSMRVHVSNVYQPTERLLEALRVEGEIGLATEGYFQDFAQRVHAIRDELTAMLRAYKCQGKRIASYGAAAKATVLLNFAGIGRDLIDVVVDRNVHKQGRYLPGVHLPIVSPDYLQTEMPEYTLLNTWNFKDEILRQQEEYRCRGGKFIVPVPSPVVV